MPEIPDHPEDQERDEKITDSGESIPVSLAAVGAWLAERYAEAQVAMGPKLIAAADETQLAINRINGEALMRAYRAGREDAARAIEAELEDQRRRNDENTQKCLRAKLEDLPMLRSHGWELRGRVEALQAAVDLARGDGIQPAEEPEADQPRTLHSSGEVQDNPEAQR